MIEVNKMKRKSLDKLGQYAAIAVTGLLLNGCAATADDKDGVIKKPETLTLDGSIIGKRTSVAKADMSPVGEETGADKEFATYSISSVTSVPTLEQEGKIAPEFDDKEKNVVISVDNMPVVDFVHYVFGELLSLNYVVAAQVENESKKVSLTEAHTYLLR